MPKLAEFTINFNLPAIEAQTDYLRHIVAEAVIPATQAGAQVFYNEVKSRAAGFADTGTLARSIYQYRNKDEQRPGHAQYKISWRKGGKKTDANASENKAMSGLPIAAHGVLVEYGYIQRYASYTGRDGKWYTRRKPGVKGTIPKYKGTRAGRQAHYDKYYQLRPGGPVQWLPRSFLRAGYEAAKGKALEAARAEMMKRINKGML